MIDLASLTEDELEAIQNRRDRVLALRDCQMMAGLLVDLTSRVHNLERPDCLSWLADRLCSRIDQMEDRP